MKLFLTSSIRFVTHEVDRLYSLEWKKIGWIWNAADQKWWSATSRNILNIEALKSIWAELVDIDLRQDVDLTIKQLDEIDALYVSWWDTYYLCELVKNKNLSQILKDRILSGLVYIGTSAWSQLASKHAYYPQDGKVHTWLWLVDFNFISHWWSDRFLERRRDMYEDMYYHDRPYIMLTDRDFIYVDGANMQIIREIES